MGEKERQVNEGEASIHISVYATEIMIVLRTLSGKPDVDVWSSAIA